MNKQSGFTLIELVIVIIILGILAATAVPKFVNLQGDAREAAMNGVKGALEGAASLTYSRVAIDGNEGNTAAQNLTLSYTANGVAVEFGYPDATDVALREAANLSAADWAMNTATANTVIITGLNPTAADLTATATAGCNVTYVQAVDADNRPVITVNVNGC
ncbi:MAG: prepilin-type N-terminal cleavage/methylation domain-containing protein [Psychromonas sp.]|nr:prepilin-type N-terminal cleavage/methylation domain-containing protein [Alteromonadales bacterium]MCP5078897.1 prepilin-type N-terminal cleavage/methylation domain-containing protein [Psychromonas sp.]